MKKNSLHSPSEGSQSGASGFTLIEMLVVIAIISLLSVLIVPAVNRAIKSARSVKSLSNLRQIGMAFQMYTQDNNERFPYTWSQSENQTWRDLIYPYIQTKDDNPSGIFISPTSKLPVNKDTERASTYAMSEELGWEKRQKGQDSEPPVALFRLQNPSSLIVIADTGQSPALGNSSFASFNATNGWWFWNPDAGNWLKEPIDVTPPDPSTGTEPGGAIAYRDRDHAACLMADGHTQRFLKGTILKENITFLH